MQEHRSLLRFATRSIILLVSGSCPAAQLLTLLPTMGYTRVPESGAERIGEV
jgi:hypothetical protein